MPRIGVALAALSLLVAALLALAACGKRHATEPPGRPGPGAVAELAPTRAELSGLAGRIADFWMRKRAPSGLFRDPLTGGARHGYGQAMLGEALMRQGLRSSNRAMTSAGITAISRTARRSTRATLLGGRPENPLALLAVASAYRWANAHLGHSRGYLAARPSWRNYLASWTKAGVGLDARACFDDPHCFHTYKLVNAVAVLELTKTGVKPKDLAVRLARRRDRPEAMAALTRTARRALGGEGWAKGRFGELGGLGVLSDHPGNPLAYHSLSALALARAVELLGRHAPHSLRETFRRVMDTEAAFVAPDGDVTYVGRAQGEVWARAASGYAAKVCARFFVRSAPATAGRCLTLGRLALRRLRRSYGFGPAGLNVIPRFRDSLFDRRGLDTYARALTFNGITALALDWAADQRPPGVPPSPRPLPLAHDGVFVDPRDARLAVVRHGPLWFAVHLATHMPDLRYDFGLVALEVRTREGWKRVLTPRPETGPGQGPDSAGPVLLTPLGVGYPAATRVDVDPRTGAVLVRGGFRTPAGEWLRRGASLRFEALPDGVRITFRASRGDRFQLEDFVPTGRAVLSPSAQILSTPSARMWVSQPPVTVEQRPGFFSAYDADLTAVRRTVAASRTGSIRWTVRATGLR